MLHRNEIVLKPARPQTECQSRWIFRQKHNTFYRMGSQLRNHKKKKKVELGRALSFPGSGPQSDCSLVPCGEGFNVLSTQVLNISTDGSSPGVPLRRPLDLAVKTLPCCPVPLSAFAFGSDIDGHMRWLKQKVTPLPFLSFQDSPPCGNFQIWRGERGGRKREASRTSWRLFWKQPVLRSQSPGP